MLIRTDDPPEMALNPTPWLKATLEAIAAGHPNDRIDELLPWNFERPST